MTIIREKPRFDTIIIWSHGLKHKKEIIDEIRRTEGFEIVRFVQYRPKSMKKFVRKVYSYDYAPLAHLKEKIAYLNSIEPIVLCIVVKNNRPKVDFYGEGKFRHSESVTLKNLKTQLRVKFNPYENGKMTHDHVIHATDNEEQSYHILNAVEDIDIRSLYIKNPFEIPYFIGKVSKCEIKTIGFNNLYCGQAEGKTDSYTIKYVEVKNSIQFQALQCDESFKCYEQYIEAFNGTALKSDYNAKKFKQLSDSFKYLSGAHKSSYVVVRLDSLGRYIILDGLHRAALHHNNDNENIRVCIIE
jgi:hypothetical protein